MGPLCLGVMMSEDLEIADQLAEAVERALDAWADNREGLLEEMRRLEEALAAYRSGGDE